MISIDIVDIDRLILVNKLKEVTDPIHIDFTQSPTEKGLFSYEIFGRSPIERKSTFAYIDLKKRFLHPAIYKLLHTMKKDVVNAINGTQKYVLDAKGNFIKDEENGESGIDFIYSVWNKINFAPTAKAEGEESSEVRKAYSTLIKKMTINEAFVSKWLVLPAFYRDLNLQDIGSGKVKVDEVNTLYRKLINLTSNLENEAMGLSFLQPRSEANIQNALLEVYNYYHNKLAKKRGIIQSKLLKKNISYSSRGVISINKTTGSSWKSSPVNYEHSGVPFNHAVAIFYPLLKQSMINFFDVFVEGSPNMIQKNRNKVALRYTPDKIEKLLKKLTKDQHSRLDTITLFTEGKKDVKLRQMIYKPGAEPVKVDITWLELIFALLQPIIKNKNVVITRYPIDNFQNVFMSRCVIVTTEKTVEAKLSMMEEMRVDFPFVPRDEKGNVAGANKVSQIDSILFSSSYLKSLGGDFDGDTVSIRSLFSQEANEEADVLRKKKIQLLNVEGKTIRVMQNEGVLAMYELTK